MCLVGVPVPARAGIGRHFYFIEFGLAFFHRRLAVERIDQHVEERRHMLALLRDQIEDMRIHLIVGIIHGLASHPLALARPRARRSLVLVHGREMPDQVAKKMNDASWIFVAKTALRCGGACLATASCSAPKPEMPTMPTLPSHQSCAAIHSTRS